MFVTDASYQEAVGPEHAKAVGGQSARHVDGRRRWAPGRALEGRDRSGGCQGVQISPDASSGGQAEPKPLLIVSELGIIFAVASALTANVAVLCKHRGATMAPTILLHAPARERDEPLSLEVVADRLCGRRRRLGLSRRRHGTRAALDGPGRDRGRPRASRPARTALLRDPPGPPRMGRPLPQRLRPRLAGPYRRGLRGPLGLFPGRASCLRGSAGRRRGMLLHRGSNAADHVRSGVMFGVAAGILVGVGSVSTKALTGGVAASGLIALVSPWSVLTIGAGLLAFFALARGLQIGPPIQVIALSSIAANVRDRRRNPRLRRSDRRRRPWDHRPVAAFCAVIAAAVLIRRPAHARGSPATRRRSRARSSSPPLPPQNP